jgi:FMN reductase
MAEQASETRDRAPVRVLIIAASLNPKASHSLMMAEFAKSVLAERGVDHAMISLLDVPLPLCDGTHDAGQHPGVKRLRKEVQASSHILFAVPVYNYGVNAAVKNLIEHLFNWKCWADDKWAGIQGKTAGFLCAAGDKASYMSVLPFANSLMLECRWWIVPRFVYAVHRDFGEAGIENQEIRDRINLLIDELLDRSRVAANSG